MLISGFFRNNNITRELPPPPNEFRNLKLRGGLTQDTIAFSSKKVQEFPTRKAAVQYYKGVAESVNKSLDENDDPTALITLEYDIDSDPYTDKITINGDYTPWFSPVIKRRGQNNGRNIITYSEAGINSERLLQNVALVTGVKNSLPPSSSDLRLHFENKNAGAKRITKKVDDAITKRTKRANSALMQGNSKKALHILGYNTSQDDRGNITIEGDYSATMADSITETKTLKDYNIDERLLLEDVTAINGSAAFSGDYEPDHYIRVSGNISVAGESNPGDKQRIENAIELQNPAFKKRIRGAKEALDSGDNLLALNLLGHKAKSEEDGSITIKGGYCPVFKSPNGIPFFNSELGLDDKKLLQNVGLIEGDLYLWNTSLDVIDKNLKVTGTVTSNGGAHLFDNFISTEGVASSYEGLNQDVIKGFASHGVLIPSLKTKEDYYFSEIEGQNKGFLDDLMQKRETVLTSRELQEKYNVPKSAIDTRLENGALVPYGIDEPKSQNSDEFMFDISDKRHKKALESLKELNGAAIPTEQTGEGVSDYDFYTACYKNQVLPEAEDFSREKYPAFALEALGYGTKADIAAHCPTFELKHCIIDNDNYRIVSPEIKKTLQGAKKDNPAVVSLDGLQGMLGKDKDLFRRALVEGRINVIAQDPFNTIFPQDFTINIADEKNREFLDSVDNKSFQCRYKDRLEAYSEYRKNNDIALEEFKTQECPAKKRISPVINPVGE